MPLCIGHGGNRRDILSLPFVNLEENKYNGIVALNCVKCITTKYTTQQLGAYYTKSVDKVLHPSIPLQPLAIRC